MIQFMCPECKTQYEVDNTFAGQEVECPNCKTAFIVPLPEDDSKNNPESPVSSKRSEEPAMPRHDNTAIIQEEANAFKSDTAMIQFMCPGCKTPYEVDNSFAGKKVKCNCGTSLDVPLFQQEYSAPPAEVLASSPISEEPDTSKHVDAAIAQDKVNALKSEKKNDTAVKNKILKYISGKRIKYVFCVIVILLAVVVSTVMFKLKSSRSAIGTVRASEVIEQKTAEINNKNNATQEVKNAEEQYTLGQSYAKKDGVAGDKAEAVKWFRKAADQGYAKAQFALGACYSYGIGIEEDKIEGIKLYRKAAEQGYDKAQFNLGVAYECGDGVPKDSAEAVKWLRKAAEQGYDKAQYELGNCYNLGHGVEKDPIEAVKWLRKDAEQNFDIAQHELGNCYSRGYGIEKNPIEAVKWYRKAAEQGHVDAQFALAGCYASGLGVEKNKVATLKWTRKAAEQGHAGAQSILGDIYYEGLGVEKDQVEAVKWYQKAAAQGDKDAQAALEKLK